MTKEPYIPNKGDVVWCDFNPRIGHEQSGRRPAIVISNPLLARSTNLAIVIPITSKIKGLPFEIGIEGKKVSGVIIPFHIKSIDIHKRKIKFIEKSASKVLNKTLIAVQNLIT